MNSRIIKNCQICNSAKLKDILNLGYIAPVNNVIDYNDTISRAISPNRISRNISPSNISPSNNNVYWQYEDVSYNETVNETVS